jgi:phage pi2 protein 07
MVQTINVTVPIPDTHIIISKVEYQELIDHQPMNMTLKEVAEYYQQTKGWIVKHIIQDGYFRRKIEPFSQFVNEDGKGKYLFNRKKMKQFLNDYDEEIKSRTR